MQKEKQIEKLKDRFIDLQESMIQSKDLNIQILKTLNKLMLYSINIEIRLQKLERIYNASNVRKLESGKGFKNEKKK